MKNDFHQRKQNRLDYAQDQASKNERLADSLNAQSKDGSIEASNKASYYDAKAHTIENNKAISSDDPDAIAKYREKLEGLEKKQKFMKEANRCVRKKDLAAFLLLEGASEGIWRELNTPRYGKVGYAGYELSNNTANIKSTKDRIAHLQAVAQIPYSEDIYGDITVIADAGKNRVQIIFPDKPKEQVREKLHGMGFHFHRGEKAWQRHLNEHALTISRKMAQEFADSWQ